MTNREEFDLYTKSGLITQSEDERIVLLINTLVDALFIPSEDRLRKVDPERVEYFGINDTEPINWGDLGCTSCDGRVAIVEEAEPDACPTLCAYIEKYMALWGWTVKVITEW